VPYPISCVPCNRARAKIGLSSRKTLLGNYSQYTRVTRNFQEATNSSKERLAVPATDLVVRVDIPSFYDNPSLSAKVNSSY
jgi:hypothetical protein